MDNGTNAGSKWTSMFLEKGLEPKHNYKMTAKLATGVVREQTSQGY